MLALGGCPPSGPPAPEPGAPAEYSIGQKGSRLHPVRLEAGQLLHAFVEQDSADVAVRLLGPGGQKTIKIDGPNGTREEEELAAVAERSGLHQIEVSCPCQSATGEPKPGKYRLRVEAPRPATAADRLRAEALRLTQEAVYEMGTSDPQAWRRQVHLRQQALDRWQHLGDRKWEAETLYQLGIVRSKLSEDAPASRLLQQAAATCEASGDLRKQALALNEAGRCFRKLEQPEEARRHFEKALTVARRTGDRSVQAKAGNNLGSILTNLGEPRKAIDYLPEAFQLARDIEDPLTENFALINLGSAYEELGERGEALKYYKGALALARERGDDRLEGMALNNLGDTYHSLGDWTTSIQHFEQALQLSRKLADRPYEVTTLNNLGTVYAKARRIQDAFRLQEQALAGAREIDNKGLQAAALTNLGLLYLGTGNPSAALERCRQALPLAQSKEQRATTLYTQGAARRWLKDLAGARNDLLSALDLSRQRQDRTQEAAITLKLAQVERDAGNLQKAGELADKAIGIVELLRGRVRSQDLRATFLAFKQPYYEFHIDTLMELHRAHPDAGFAARALEQSERAKARSLLDILTEAVAEIRRGADPRLLERERELRGDLLALDRYRQELISGDKASSERVTDATSRLEQTLRLYQDVEGRLKRSSPRYWALTNPEPLSAERLRNEVAREALLLEYSLGEKRSYLWAVTAGSVATFVLPPRHEIENTARLFYKRLTARNDPIPEGESPQAREARIRRADLEAAEAGEKLAAMILPPDEPLRGALLGELPILVVPDGALHYVPFTALPIPSSAAQGRGPLFLMDRHEVTHLPSASVLSVLRMQAPPAIPRKTVAVLAAPIFRSRNERLSRNDSLRNRFASIFRGDGPGGLDRSRLPSLPFSRKEALAIRSMVPPDQIFLALGHQASVATATSGKLARYQVVHFATHGLIDSERPELSSLVLSQVDERGRPDPRDGELRLSDIYNLELNADLVVLSACRTALGKEIRGEGLVGLTRGFMYAGADRVLASLWNVEDRPTADLMAGFYQGLLKQGMSPAAALRQAQRKLARGTDEKWRSPYYWAGFSLQGELR
jgi:CHAT domain-containing protein/tetratricopeptide (TPR) repeat protein